MLPRRDSRRFAKNETSSEVHLATCEFARVVYISLENVDNYGECLFCSFLRILAGSGVL